MSNRDTSFDFAKRNRNQRTMKNLFSSMTIIGVFVALFSKVFGIEISSSEAGDIISQTKALWPVIVGIGADLAAFWYRVKATNFHTPAFQSPTFWSGVLSGAMTLTAAFGLDLTGLHAILERGLAAWPAVSALVGSVLIIVGRYRASQKIAVQTSGAGSKALILFALFSMTSCGLRAARIDRLNREKWEQRSIESWEARQP